MPMGHPRLAHGSPTDTPLHSRGPHMGLPVGSPSVASGSPVSRPCDAHGPPVGGPTVTHGSLVGYPRVTRVSPMGHQGISREKFHELAIQGAKPKSKLIQIMYIVDSPSNLLRDPHIRIPTGRDMPVWCQQHPPYGGMAYKRHYSQHVQAANTYFPPTSHEALTKRVERAPLLPPFSMHGAHHHVSTKPSL